MKDAEENGDEVPAMHIPKLDILDYGIKKKLYKRFKEDPDAMGENDLQQIQEMDQDELMELISDDENSDDYEDVDESDDEAEDVDVEELDSDGFEELDADEEVVEFDSSEEGLDGDEESGDENDIERVDESDNEENDAKLGKRKAPVKDIKSILKKSKPVKKVKTGNPDGPESTINDENSETLEGEDGSEDESSDLDLSSDDGFNSERKRLGFLHENDIYTHKPTRAEQRRINKEEFEEVAKTKKSKAMKEERGQKTNKDKTVNKPFMMTIGKKAKKANSYKQLRVKNSQMKNQLGHVHKGMKGNLKSKMRKLRT